MSPEGETGGLVAFDQVHLPVLLIPVGPFYIGWVLAAGRLLPDTWHFLVALISIFPFLGLGTVLLNDAYDARVDARSHRKDSFRSSLGSMGPGTLTALAGLSLVVAVVLALMVSLGLATVIAGLACLAVLYSVPPAQLSRRPGLDLLVNMVGIGVLCTIAGWLVASPDSLPPLDWLITSALGTGTFFVLTVLMDIDTDAEGGKRTLAVRSGWRATCWLGTVLIGLADVGIVYMSLASIILKPAFLWIAWPVIVGELAIFPVLAGRRDLLRTATMMMGGLLFLGNLLILLSYLNLIGPF